MSAASRKAGRRCTPFWSTKAVAMATMGISTNTRLLGMAIITEEGLAVHKVYLHKSPWSPSKANLIISSLEPCVRQYSITSVVLSIPPSHHQTRAFCELHTLLREYFLERNIVFSEISVEELYTFCSDKQRKTKAGVLQALNQRYPELSTFYQKEMRNKAKYYTKLFEAVGMATLHQQAS